MWEIWKCGDVEILLRKEVVGEKTPTTADRECGNVKM
jgi:hypothetical protein